MQAVSAPRGQQLTEAAADDSLAEGQGGKGGGGGAMHSADSKARGRLPRGDGRCVQEGNREDPDERPLDLAALALLR